jgi:HCOMODA/2-hydroxy-3-carboxy-muconic semialdehyde decarboxylase
MAAFIGPGLPVFDIKKYSGVTDMLITDLERARGLVEVLGNNDGVLMRGHGSAVVGPNIRFAVGRSIYLELNAKLQVQAVSLGGSVTYLDPEEATAVKASGELVGYTRPWELWKKKALQTMQGER